jgi:hypothetical protein
VKEEKKLGMLHTLFSARRSVPSPSNINEIIPLGENKPDFASEAPDSPNANSF